MPPHSGRFFNVFPVILLGLLLLACEKNTTSPPASDASSASVPPAVTGHAQDQRPPHPLWTNFETGANVKTLAFDGKDLWLGLSNGVIRYDTTTPDTHEIYTSRNTGGALLSNGIYTIKVDAQGKKWIGTYGGGLTIYDERQWTTYTPYGGGQPASYGKQWQVYPMGTGLGDLWVYDVAFDKAGNAWIATWKGASKFDGRTFTTYTTQDGLIDKWVYAIAIDRDDIFWFGTEGGVTRYDGKTWKSYTHEDGLGAEVSEGQSPTYETPGPHHTTPEKNVTQINPNYVLAIAVDGENHKWFGTWGAGLSRFDGKEWTTYTTENGLGGNFVHAAAIDPEGILWVGTDGGVSRFDGTRWKTYTTQDGLLNNNVFSMAFDDDGGKWFGTWTGLSKLEEP